MADRLEDLLTLCEVCYYNHKRALSLREEGREGFDDKFVADCEEAHRLARARLLLGARQATRGVEMGPKFYHHPVHGRINSEVYACLNDVEKSNCTPLPAGVPEMQPQQDTEALVTAYGRACVDWAQADADEAQQRYDEMQAARASLLAAPGVKASDGEGS